EVPPQPRTTLVSEPPRAEALRTASARALTLPDVTRPSLARLRPLPERALSWPRPLPLPSVSSLSRGGAARTGSDVSLAPALPPPPTLRGPTPICRSLARRESERGKLVADLAKRLGLKHVVFSGLENVQKLTGGRLTVPHFDGKGEVEEYFWSIGVPMTSVRLAAYFENFLTLWKPAKASDGDYYTLAIPMGDVPMHGISVADAGAAILSIFNSPEEFLGKAVGLSAEALTVQQYCDVFSKTLGKDVRDTKITPEAYEKLSFPAAKELADMCRFYQMQQDRDVALTHRLNPRVRSFNQFISDNLGAFKGL
uniref:NmrA-like family domain-containing protein 1 n=1 Tax=Oryctolagus cuniculus TaxID=9986 RepID=A0A5F9CTH4_RABIT